MTTHVILISLYTVLAYIIKSSLLGIITISSAINHHFHWYVFAIPLTVLFQARYGQICLDHTHQLQGHCDSRQSRPITSHLVINNCPT